MAAEISPGTVISVTVTKSPTNEAAAKTLSRIFAKDPENKRERGRRKKLLVAAVEVRRRGGRPWEVRSKAPRLVQPIKGDGCRITASSDVLRDLGSVQRFVAVKPV
ncbi:MAG: hypothetical protein HS101_12090 [Planctomycetia bacterium]|nr:hypothetical protein [Planctomycetia bacterium]MCC7316079.1 hypothetical protein [Planctomycetota bacterium]